MASYLRRCLTVAAFAISGHAHAHVRAIPTFAAWHATHHYLADEVDYSGPDHAALTPAQLRTDYDAQAAHPQWVSVIDCRDALKYRGSFDGLMADDYPFYVGRSSADSLREWQRTVTDCRKIARRLNVPLILIMQGFGGMRDGSMLWRCPTTAEWRVMLASPVRLIRYTIPGHPCRSHQWHAPSTSTMPASRARHKRRLTRRPARARSPRPTWSGI